MTPTDDDYKRAMQLAVAIANEPETFPDVEAIANAIACTLAAQREQDGDLVQRRADGYESMSKEQQNNDDRVFLMRLSNVLHHAAEAIRSGKETP